MGRTNIGRIAILHKGSYSSVVSYARLDAVLYNGSSYICKVGCTGIPPTNTSYWQVMAEKGDKMQFSDLTDEEKDSLKGEVGATGPSGVHVDDNLVIFGSTGSSATGVMSQFAVTKEISKLQTAIDALKTSSTDFIVDVQESGLYFVDENMNIGPHIVNSIPNGFMSYREVKGNLYTE